MIKNNESFYLKKLLHLILSILTILFVIAILLAYISVWISPEVIWIFAFFGLFYPYFLIGNFFLLIYWLFQKKKISVFILVVILLGWNHMGNYFQVFSRGSDNIQLSYSNDSVNHQTANLNPEPIKLLSYNVRLFNFYNQKNNKSSAGKILNYIKEENADIVCLQEILVSKLYNLSLSDFKEILKKTPYSYVKFVNKSGSGRNYGIAIFSRFPIINKGEVRFKNTSNISIFADILVGTDTVRLYNNHLQSFQLGSDNFRFLTAIDQTFEDETIEEIQDISFRMKNAYIKRAGQSKEISRLIHASPYQVIVCGDFNDTPVSYTYRILRKGLNDAFVESGRGLGNTYAQIFPSYRIDYILYSDLFRSIDFKTIHKKFSDHYPISCSLVFNEKK